MYDPNTSQPGGGGRGGPAEPSVDEAEPLSARARLRKLRAEAGATLAGIPRALQLVWHSHRGYTIGMVVFSILFGFLPAVTAWLGKLLIDAVVAAMTGGARQDLVNTVIWLVVLQFILFIVTALLQTVRSINQQALQELTSNRVQLMVMEHANRLDLQFFENPKFYDLLQQAQREATRRPVALVDQLFGLVRSVITFTSMIALMSRLGWLVAVAALIAPIPAFIANTRYGRQGFRISRRQSPERRRMGYYLDLLTRDTYNKEIKLFGLGDYFIGRWRAIADGFYTENQALSRRRNLMGFALGSLSTIVASATFLYIAFQVVARRLTLGDLTFFTQAIGQVQSSFSAILTGITGMYENTLYLGTLYEFLDYQPTVRNPAQPRTLRFPLEQGIEFRDVTFTYPGKRAPALSNVSFTLRPRQSVALVGHNGAGKSTIVKLLTRLYDPSAGQILLEGHDLRSYNLSDIYAAVGVIFQDYVTYYFSAADNIGLGRVERIDDQARIADAAAKSGAAPFIEALPKGYATTLGRWFDEGYQLSGGEWQKVALARAFMRDAAILILDEPTASLDARAENEIFTRMKTLTTDKITLFISHRFSTVRLADCIIVLEGGKVIEQGTHEALLAHAGIYAELFELQAAAYR